MKENAMPSGGARSRSGPAPDPGALRRNRPDDQGEWVVLPAEGRGGDEPRWPLTGISDRERYIWREFWTKPQAIMWERNGQHYEVALLVRSITEAELPGCSANLRTLVRQMMDSLGLTVPGMRSARWKIAAAPAPVEDEAPRAGGGESVRNRLRVVKPT